MIIDIHTHTFPEKIAAAALKKMQASSHIALFSDGTEAGLIQSERRAQADVAVVQPAATNPAKVSHMNDTVIRVNETSRETGLISFGAMHPAFEGWEKELERLKAAGVKGIKLHPPYSSVPIDDPRSIAVLRKCRELRLIVLVHSGWDVGLPESQAALPEKIRRALDAAGPVRLIAGHMGGWRCWEDALRYLLDTGAYLDTAFSLGAMTPAPDHHPWTREGLALLGTQEFCQLVRAFGADRILFGTDSPWGDPKEEVEKIRALPLTQEERNAILGENAKKLLEI